MWVLDNKLIIRYINAWHEIYIQTDGDKGNFNKDGAEKRVIMELIVFLTTKSVCLVSVIVILFGGLEIETPFSFAYSFKAIYVKGTHAIKNKVKWKVLARPSKIISPDAGTLFLKRKRNKISFAGDFYQLIKESPKKTFEAVDSDA